jgi:hypothetical protein
MLTSKKKESATAAPAGVALTAGALAVVLICACVALLVGTSGGVVTPEPQPGASPSASPAPSPAQATAASVGRLNKNQEWVLIGFLAAFPSLALVFFYRLVSRLYRSPEPAAQVVGRLFNALDAATLNDKLAWEQAFIKDIDPAIQPEALEKDTAAAKRFALDQLSRDKSARVERFVGLENDSLDTAFDGVLESGDSVTLVEVRFLPRNCVRALIARDGLIASWLRQTRDRANRVSRRLCENEPPPSVSLLLITVTSGLSGNDGGDDEDFKKFKAALNINLNYNLVRVERRFHDLSDLRKKLAPSDDADSSGGEDRGTVAQATAQTPASDKAPEGSGGQRVTAEGEGQNRTAANGEGGETK